MKINAVNINTNSVLVQNRPVMRQAYTGVQVPDTFERTTFGEINVKPAQVEVREEFSDTISTLITLHDKAKTTFDKQVALDGWSGKLADKISALWGSKNRATVVSRDLNEFDKTVQNLDKAAKSGNFRAKFKENFGIDFNKDAIDNFKKISEKNDLIQVSSKIALETNKKLGSYVSYFEKKADYLSPDRLSDTAHRRFEESRVKFGEFKRNLSSMVGGEKNLKKLAAEQNENFAAATTEEQVKVYVQIAKQLITTSKETAKSIQGGQTEKELQKEYDEAYTKAFGSENNIIKRVDKYVRSQQVGAVLVRDSLLAATIGATIATSGTAYPILMGSGMSVVGNIGLDVSEMMTNNTDNKIDLSKKEVGIIIKDAAITGAEYMVGSALYEVIPMAATGSKVANGALNVARTLGIELTTAFVAEYARTGKWATEQIDPKTFVKLTLATYGIEELARIGLSSYTKTVGKNRPVPPKVMENFTERANEELQKMYTHAPKDVLNLKFISMQNPEKFSELLALSLPEVLAEM